MVKTCRVLSKLCSGRDDVTPAASCVGREREGLSSSRRNRSFDRINLVVVEWKPSERVGAGPSL